MVVVLTVITAQCLVIAAFLLTRHLCGDGPPLPAYMTALLSPLALHLPALAAICVLARRYSITPKNGFGLSRRSALKKIVIGLGLCAVILPVVWLTAIGSHKIFTLAGMPPDRQPVINMVAAVAGRPWWIVALVMVQAVIVAPIIEETVFRGVALPALAKKLGTAPTIILISTIFAVLHNHPPVYAPLFIFSVALNYAYLRSKSLIVPITIHVVFNLIPVALLTLTELL